MARNLSEIGDVLQQINYTFPAIDTDNIVSVAIETTNASSDGWTGITVFIIMCIAVFIHIFNNQNKFKIFDNFNLLFISTNIFIDIGIYLLVFGILESLQIFIFIFVMFFVFLVVSLLRKEVLSVES